MRLTPIRKSIRIAAVLSARYFTDRSVVSPMPTLVSEATVSSAILVRFGTAKYDFRPIFLMAVFLPLRETYTPPNIYTATKNDGVLELEGNQASVICDTGS